MSDWWSKKLQTPARTPQYSTPPVTPPAKVGIRIPQEYQQQPQTPPSQQITQDPRAEIRMGDAILMWKGGEGTRDASNCPSCGSHLYFSRTKSSVNGAHPAPHCYSCGFNAKFDQGDQSNWA